MKSGEFKISLPDYKQAAKNKGGPTIYGQSRPRWQHPFPLPPPPPPKRNEDRSDGWMDGWMGGWNENEYTGGWAGAADRCPTINGVQQVRSEATEKRRKPILTNQRTGFVGRRKKERDGWTVAKTPHECPPSAASDHFVNWP